MDIGLNCLVAIAPYHQLAAEPEQLLHQVGTPGDHFTEADILLSAKTPVNCRAMGRMGQ